ncbi:hypothetical protein M4D55_04475 [Metabacillus idriensis]|uniref:hypothetical protein n=1 Tax=Metabacillus idriensis TaxID=324768 RepID=UPI00203F1E60|nr:hypothetical protein [Metabacillus idriensis]MCM3595039.1 hypothetical protein [Metabacillus idriensis]
MAMANEYRSLYWNENETQPIHYRMFGVKGIFMNDSIYLDLLKDDLFNIYEGEIYFIDGGKKITTKASITMQISPYPRIVMYPHDFSTLKGFEHKRLMKCRITTDKNEVIIPNRVSIRYENQEHNTYLDLELTTKSFKTRDEEVNNVKIFIMNCGYIFYSYLEEAAYQLTYGDWTIDFKFRPDKQDISSFYKTLKGKRGYDVTHVGTIYKNNNKNFNTEEIIELISWLEWYLSFCSAQQVFIPIQLGFVDERKVWEHYVIIEKEISHYQDNTSWGTIHEAEPFNKSFSNVVTKLRQDIWEDVLKVVLNWYLEVMGNGMTENKIIATQVALEQLSWVYLVNQEQILDKEAYAKLRTTDILRLLFYQLKIQKKIDSEFTVGKQLLKKYNNDGVYMFVECRNSLVHPEKKKNKFQWSNDEKTIACYQGIDFLEKALKEIIGFGKEE